MADSQRKSYNLFDVNGQRTSTYAGISIVDDTIYISRIYGGAASYLIYAYTYSAGTYTISLDYTGDLTKVRFLSTTSFEGGTYNSYYNAYYKDFDSSKTMTLTFDSDFRIGFAFDGTNGGTGIVSDIMMNTGNQPKPHEPYGWVHSLRKLTTATDTLTTLPADGNNATVGLVGNMQQTGTPTPQNPIQPQETGDRTAQLWDISSWDGATAQRGTLERVTNGYKLTATSNDAYTMTYGSGIYSYSVIGGNEYTISWTVDNPQIYGVVYIFTGTSVADTPLTTAVASSGSKTFTVPSGHNYVAFRLGVSSIGDEITYTNIMLSLSSTAKPYEPYGYKIPISSPVVTTNIYLGSTQTVRQIKKYTFTGEETIFSCVATTDEQNYCVAYRFMDFGMTDIKDFDKIMEDIDYPIFISTHFKEKTNTNSEFNNIQPNQVGANTVSAAGNRYIIFCIAGLTTAADYSAWFAQQYTNGTPVEVYYILETETTGIVNEPLRKIGNYADTVSGITIPTITGKDTFDVQTTLKPSEVSLAYTGWHDATVKEWDGSQWNK